MKPWYESKTMWVNVLSLAVVVVGTVAGWDEMRDYAPQLLVVVNLLNLTLRVVTHERII